MRYLLDLNVMIPAHVQHDRAHLWFEKLGKKACASCPLTENGVLRIVGHPRYPNSPGMPAAVAELMSGLLVLPRHEFWAEDVSLLDSQLTHCTRLLQSVHVTNSYILALAVAHRGQLATFDQNLIPDAVVNGQRALHLIP
jgi:uncharacterized protein